MYEFQESGLYIFFTLASFLLLIKWGLVKLTSQWELLPLRLIKTQWRWHRYFRERRRGAEQPCSFQLGTLECGCQCRGKKTPSECPLEVLGGWPLVIVGYQGIITGRYAPSSFPRLIRGLDRQRKLEAETKCRLWRPLTRKRAALVRVHAGEESKGDRASSLLVILSGSQV